MAAESIMVKEKMKKFRISALIALLPMLAGCSTKIVDSQYPEQKLYFPAATRGEVFVIESVDTHVAQTPTPGSTFTFTIDWANGFFRVPLSVYRAGINNNGIANAEISDAWEKVSDMIDDGTLPEGTKLLDEAFYTIPQRVSVADGRSSVIFNVEFDLDYLMSNAPKNKFAVGLTLKGDGVAVNEDYATLVILINTKVFDDPNLPTE